MEFKSQSTLIYVDFCSIFNYVKWQLKSDIFNKWLLLIWMKYQFWKIRNHILKLNTKYVYHATTEFVKKKKKDTWEHIHLSKCVSKRYFSIFLRY